MKRIKLPIWSKLLIIVFSLIMIVTITVAHISYNYFEQTLLHREEYSNISETKYLSNQIEQILQSLILKSTELAKKIKMNQDIYLKNEDIVGLEIVEKNGNKTTHKIYDQDFIKKNKLNLDFFNEKNKSYIKNLDNLKIFNLNNDLNIGLLIIPFIQINNNITHYLFLNFRLDYFQKNIQLNENKSIYFTNMLGDIIWLSKNELDLSNRDFGKTLVENSKKELILEKQIQFEENSNSYIGSFVKSPNFDIIVFSQINKNLILEPAKNVKNKIYYISSLVLSLSIFIVYLFSKSITSSITILSRLVKKVSKGNFSVKSSHFIKNFFLDETSELAEDFDNMTIGLMEREKAKNILNKFHGKAITENLLNKDLLNIEGEKKDVIVFFSDIRNFTNYSENHSPEEVVSMLNEYFELMVKIITSRGGTIDKFIGDAIMAVWGVPNSYETDHKNAMMACLDMRKELVELNKKRISRGQQPIVIGMGLHCGSAISGIIGSVEKMEYTIIGDTVNMAARIESSTKKIGTDLLVSESIIKYLSGLFIFEKINSIKIKGKSKQELLFKVNGYVENGVDIEVKSEYSSFNPEVDDSN